MTQSEWVRQQAIKIAQPWPGAEFDPNDPVCVVRKEIAEAIAAIPIDIRTATPTGTAICGCTERCKDRDNCQYEVKPPSTPRSRGS